MIDEIRSFCVVVEQRSLAKAAKLLGVSKPKMTRQIQHLENELKAKLLHRSTRDVNLTEAGMLFYQQALEIISHYEAGTKAVQSLYETVSGTVKIGLPVSISHLWVAPVLDQFCLKYPDVNILIVNGNHLLGLLKEGFDVIIHCGTLPDSSFYYRKIRDWNKIACASPQYLKKFGTPKHPRDLEHHNCIDHYDNVRSTWRYNIDGNEEEVFVRGSIKVNSSIAIKTLVQSGLGISYLPEFSIQKELNSGNLIAVLEPFRPKPFGMYAVYPSNEYLSKKTITMLDFLVEILEQ